MARRLFLSSGVSLCSTASEPVLSRLSPSSRVAAERGSRRRVGAQGGRRMARTTAGELRHRTAARLFSCGLI
eukprot:4651564-Pleurochrysis_carterae.AAC.5